RRALLEAVFDQKAASGGLHRIAEAMSGADPHAGLREIVSIFCDFWSNDPGAIARLMAAGATRPGVDARRRGGNERRRHLLVVLVGRIAEGSTSKARNDLVDVLFALTSFPFFAQLTTGGRSRDAACRLIQDLASDAVGRALGG